MAIYIAIPLLDSSIFLNAAVESSIPEADRHKLQADRGWLIRYNGTSIELSDKIGITGQTPGETSRVGPTIIVPVSTYYGRGPAEMWEWLKTRIEQ